MTTDPQDSDIDPGSDSARYIACGEALLKSVDSLERILTKVRDTSQLDTSELMIHNANVALTQLAMMHECVITLREIRDELRK